MKEVKIGKTDCFCLLSKTWNYPSQLKVWTVILEDVTEQRWYTPYSVMRLVHGQRFRVKASLHPGVCFKQLRAAGD